MAGIIFFPQAVMRAGGRGGGGEVVVSANARAEAIIAPLPLQKPSIIIFSSCFPRLLVPSRPQPHAEPPAVVLPRYVLIDFDALVSISSA